MNGRTLGFIGGGRVARIILGGLKKALQLPETIVASDTNPDVLKKLQAAFPGVRAVLNGNREAAAQDLVFLGLHPPAIGGCLAEIRGGLKPNAILISLAPKLSIARLKDGLGGFDRTVRLIPNAASIIGEGFNPVAYSEALRPEDKNAVRALLRPLGRCPEVEEGKLEAYAMITAMGPTYMWFQWQELCSLAESFGMSPAEAATGVGAMVAGSASALFASGMPAEEVMDLIPVRPLGDEEHIIRAMYVSKPRPLYEKLKG